MILKKLFFFSVLILVCISCAREPGLSISGYSAAYYRIYEERIDMQTFLNFYDEEFIFEDIILGLRISEKEKLADFFDWTNPSFKRSSEHLFVLTNQVIDDNQVVTQGYFNSFYWEDKSFHPMHFTTVLTFNKQGKIIKHVDWINYPSDLLDYNSRENSNEWIRQ